MFDLPTETKLERKKANNFRKTLLKMGFVRIQFSVYTRVCNGLDNAKKYIKLIDSIVPEAGSVRSLLITDKQYESMVIHLGKKTRQEKIVSSEQLVLF